MAVCAFMNSGKLVSLLTSADPLKQMTVQVLNATQLGLGIDPRNPTAIIDVPTEKVLPFEEERVSTGKEKTVTDIGETSRSPRRSGDYWYEIDGKRSECSSLKELLSRALVAIEHAVPGTLEKLSHIKPRSRRIVARDPKELFDKPHLAKDYAEKLGNGWYFGTNNSADETDAWLRRACSCAGLKWGEQFQTSLPPSRPPISELA